MIFFNENFFWKDSDNFWHRKLTLKIRHRHFLITWSTKKLLRWKSTIYHSIKLPFDVEVAEKFLNGIYWVRGERRREQGATDRTEVVTSRTGALWLCHNQIKKAVEKKAVEKSCGKKLSTKLIQTPQNQTKALLDSWYLQGRYKWPCLLVYLYLWANTHIHNSKLCLKI